jgi:hypothetical protein
MNFNMLAPDELVFPGLGVAAEAGLAVGAGVAAGAGLAAGAGVAVGAALPAGAIALGAGQPAGAQRTAMRWTEVNSAFILCRMCQLIESGVRTDKGFKEVHLNQVAKALQEFSGGDVTGTQIYNHLRKWRVKWVRISKLRELSGALWNEDQSMIVLEEEHYNGHIKVLTLHLFFMLLHRTWQCVKVILTQISILAGTP